MRDSGTETGFDKGVWTAMGEMGWAGILIPEDQGGVAMGHLTFGVVLEELGRQLTASPLLASAGIGAFFLEMGASPEASDEIFILLITQDWTLVSRCTKATHLQRLNLLLELLEFLMIQDVPVAPIGGLIMFS